MEERKAGPPPVSNSCWAIKPDSPSHCHHSLKALWLSPERNSDIICWLITEVKIQTNNHKFKAEDRISIVKRFAQVQLFFWIHPKQKENIKALEKKSPLHGSPTNFFLQLTGVTRGQVHPLIKTAITGFMYLAGKWKWRHNPTIIASFLKPQGKQRAYNINIRGLKEPYSCPTVNLESAFVRKNQTCLQNENLSQLNTAAGHQRFAF